MMKTRIILTILMALGAGLCLLSQFEGSEAAGPETTMEQELEMVGQAGGEVTAVAVQSGYAYVAAGARMQIYDVFEPTNPLLVSQTDAYTDVQQEVAVADAYAYLGQRGGVVHVLDVTDPFAPVERGSLTLVPPQGSPCAGADISQIETQGHYTYVVLNVFCLLGYASSLHILDMSDPANPQEVSHYIYGDGLWLTKFHISVANNRVFVGHDSYLSVLDVSDPANPTVLTEYEFEVNTYVQDIAVVGNYVYILTLNRFYIFDIAQPGGPAEIGHHSRGGEEMVLAGNQAYVLGSGFYVLDVANKAHPKVMAANQTIRPHAVAMAGGYAFVAADQLYVFAITNLSDPVEVADIDISAFRDMYTVNNLAYLATYNGFQILDISQIEQPTLMGSSDACSDANGTVSAVYVQGNIAYLGGYGSLCVLDVSQPNAPVLLHSHVFETVEYTDSWVNTISLQGDFLYVNLDEESCAWMCDYYSTLRILDVSSPASPVEVAMFNDPPGGVGDVVVAGNYAYLSGGYSLRVLSLANPIAPMEVASLAFPDGVNQIAVVGNRGYMDSGYGRITIINLQDPTQPFVLGTIDTLNRIQDMTAIGNKVYAISTYNTNTYNYNLQVIDVTVPTAPVISGQYAFDTSPMGLHIVGDYAFLPMGDGSTLIVDTTQLGPLAATAVTQWPLSEVNTIISNDGYLYIVSGQWIQILQPQEGAMPIVVGEYLVSTNPDDIIDLMVVSGAYLFVRPRSEDVVQVVDISQPAQPTLLGRTSFWVENVATAGDTVYFTDYSGLAIWNYSDPNNPTQVGYYQPVGNASSGFVKIIGHYAYLYTDYEYNSLDIVDVSNPAAPMHVGFVPLTSWINDIVVDGRTAYVLVDYGDIQVLDVSDPGAPQLISSIYIPCVNMQIAGQIAYVADSFDGVGIVDISDPGQLEEIGFFELPVTRMLAIASDEIYVAGWEAGLFALRPNQESITATVTQFSAPSNDVTFQFEGSPPVSMEPVRYQRWWQDEPAAGLLGMEMRFEVTAVTSEPSLQGTQPYSLTIHYDPAQLGAVREETLALYRQEGEQWLREPSSTLDIGEQTITAVPEEMGQFAVLGETYRTYLTAVPYSHSQQGYRLFLTLDQSGSVFDDLSGYGHNGRCQSTACPTIEPGISQMARHFDGVNDAIQMANSQAFNVQDEITIAAWIKPETSGGLQNIVAHGYSTAPQGEVFLRIANGQYEVGSWNGSDHKTGYPIPAGDIGQWVYLVGVYDGTAWRLYRNGVEVSSAVDDTGAVSVHGRWAVGATGNDDGRFFQGSIDEVIVYEHGLTAAEVEALYETYLSQ